MSQNLPKASAMNSTNLSGFMFENDKIEDITDILNKGGLILYPTDTVWSVGCDATNPEAIDKVFALKQRDPSLPISLMVDSIEMIKKYVVEIHPRVETLLMHHKRPLTIIYPEACNLPDNLVPLTGSIAIRIVQDPFCQALVQHFGRPLVATSASLETEATPSHFGEINSNIIQGVDYIVKHRRSEVETGEPTVVISFDMSGDITFIRE